MTKAISNKTVLKTPIFEIQELTLSKNGIAFPHPYYRIECPDWVNVLPITEDNEALMIKQYRAGSLSTILETPGGVVDPHEIKDPTLTAARELEEETGYTSDKFIFLGSMNPNPAWQNNQLHFFLALSCKKKEKREHFPDPGEQIENVKVRVDELESLVHLGKVDHGLSALCILLAGKHIKIRA